MSTFGKGCLESESLPVRVFASIWAVESEVNNGGFGQYFQNSSAATGPFVVQALEIVGAPRTADICRRAIAIAFPAGLPPTAEAISAAAAEFGVDKLDDVDSDFVEYPHDLTELLFAYVAEHPEAFGTLPKGG